MGTVSNTSDGTISITDGTNFVAQNLFMRTFSIAAIRAVLDLGIADILDGAEGRKPLSAEEILEQLPTKSTPGPTSVRNLQRLLGPLVREGLFTESLNGDEQPAYGLTKVSQWLVRGSPGGDQLSIAPVADLVFTPERENSERCLHELILDETATPFIKAHGVSLYEYNNGSELGVRFKGSMKANSNIFFGLSFESLMQNLRLDSVDTLVDVGGSDGHIIAAIVARYPHIKGINFDMPAVVATASAINGVQHVAGDFFESVPSGDVMFLKWIIHNYADEEAIQILKNCFKALPTKNGRVVLGEFLKDKQDKSPQASYVEYMDLVMLTFCKGAMERSKEEYQAILLAAGFSRCTFTQIQGGMTLIEGFKE